MNRPIFICPVCSSPLSLEGRSYYCVNNHSYDISKEGYVNLLLANQKQSRDPGDSKEMLEARKSFLNRGYYKPLARAVASIIIKYKRKVFIVPLKKNMSYCQRRRFDRLNVRTFSVTEPSQFNEPIPSPEPLPVTVSLPVIEPIPVTESVRVTEPAAVTEPVEVEFTILDAGCGEGYYTDYISRNHYINTSSIIYGIDISKDGIKSASKRSRTINFAVAGIYNLPILDSSVDTLLNIFAPFNGAEFDRVLKDHGLIISVTPGSHHLYELKKNLYDEVYLNDEEFNLPDKFYIADTVRVKYELNIHNGADIANLLKMTPYYHKSSPEKINSFLETTNELDTTADFVIRILKKNT